MEANIVMMPADPARGTGQSFVAVLGAGLDEASSAFDAASEESRQR